MANIMDKIISLSKRRGFIYSSSEIYGGIAGIYDFGPLGAELLKNIKDLWWHDMVQQREDIYGINGSILMHPRAWEASGHVAGFSDPLVECQECKKRVRPDKLKGCFLRGEIVSQGQAI
jgi:glycyl-tRNA synthetase